MIRTTANPAQPVDREQLRQQLLKLIVKKEAERRDQRKAGEK
jgi:hypothetical protein